MQHLILIAILGFLGTACSKNTTPVSRLADDHDHDDHPAGGELKVGKYFGFITMDQTNVQIPTVIDFYIVQPEDITDFPRLNANVRLSLGGYNAREYISEVIEDIHYDYDNGTISIDSSENDLVISAEVHHMQKLMILGDVWIQSAAASGKLRVEYLTDEPGDGDEPGDNDSTNIIPPLTGQYIGLCDGKKSALQIRTVRGLGGSEDSKGLSSYGISTTLARDDRSMCGSDSNDNQGQPTWCTIRTFNEGSFNPFSGNLILKRANGTENCQFSDGKVQCRFRMLDHTEACEFQQPVAASAQHQFYNRSFQLQPTSAQREALPPPNPPANTELMTALRGQFSGYIHYEQTNTYQVVRLNVVATTSTDNPHNENAVYVTTTSVQHFGPGLSQEFWVQRLSRRQFNLSPGFTLEGETSDSFIQIDDWRKGYIKGGFYSHSYGRIGSIQLVKGPLPPAPSGLKFVSSIVGEFEGPVDRASITNRIWWFKTFVPSQPEGRDSGVLEFYGEAHFKSGIITPHKIEKGTYDLNTGSIGWITAENDASRMIMGNMVDEHRVDLLWPGAPKYGVGMWNYQFYGYERQ